MSDKVVLQLQDVTRHGGSQAAVEHCSATFYEGEIIGLVGPNGAGKTTLIKMIVHQLRPNNGKIVIGGVDIHEDYAKAMRSVGAIIDTPAYYPYMTGMDHLKLAARMYPEVTSERIRDVVEFTGLKNWIDDKVRKYSLGMRQRLAIAEALLLNPSLLLLDEPTNGLDPMGIKDLRILLKKIAAKGVCVVVSSHILSEMDLLCSRIVIMRRGEFVADLSSQELLDPNRVRVHIRVGQPEKAYEVLEAFVDDAKIRLEDEVLIITGENLQVQQLNRMLIFQDIDVYEIGVHKESLEESFLELMRGDEDVESDR